MKLRLLIHRSLFLLLFGAAFSRVCAQPASTYTFSSPASSFVYIPGDGTSLISGTGSWNNGNVFTNVPLGFTFYFEGQPYTTVGVSSNGFIWFGSGTVSTTEYNPISDPTLGTGTINGVVAAYGTQLGAFPSTLSNNETGTPEISYGTSGENCSQVFTVQWKGAYAASDPGIEGSGSSSFASSVGDDNRVDLQIKLDQTTNEIAIYVSTYPYPYRSNASSSGEIGIRGVSNTDFTSMEVTNTCSIFSLNPIWKVKAQTTNNAEMCTNEPCYASPNASYNFTPPPCSFTLNTSSSNPACGNNGTITVSPSSGSGFTYIINNGASADTNTTGSFTGLGTGTFCIAVTNGTCAENTSVTLTSATTTTPTVSNNGPLCGGDSLILSTGMVSGATYHWTGPNGFSSSQQDPVIPNVTVAAAGTYTLTDSIVGCASSPATTTVVIGGTAPAAPTASSNSPVCSGSTLDLMASTVAGALYSWSGPNSYSSGQQNPTIPNATSANSGTYSVYTYNGSCKSPAVTITVSVGAAPALAGATSNSPVCSGDTLSLSAPSLSGASYLWTGPNSFSDTAQNPSIPNISSAGGGGYIVIAHFGNCTSTPDTLQVSVNQVPTAPVLTSNADTICSNDSAQVCAPNNFSVYRWSNGTSTTYCTFAKNAGGYWVTVTDANGCSVISQHKDISTYPITSVSIVVKSDTLYSYGASAYQWYRNDTVINGANQSVYIATSPGSYSVEITDGNGCTSTSSQVSVGFVGVHDISGALNFSVYPNPASGSFNIVYTGMDDQNIQLNMYDILGDKVKQENLLFANGRNKTIDISALPRGVYLLQFMQQGGQQFTKKLVVQ